MQIALPSSWHATLAHAFPPGIHGGENKVQEGAALTSEHTGHGGHVPAANVLVEKIHAIKHCASPTHATSNTQHMIHNTNQKNESEFQKVFERMDSQGKSARKESADSVAIVVARDPCTRISSGDPCRGRYSSKWGGTYFRPYWSRSTRPTGHCPG